MNSILCNLSYLQKESLSCSLSNDHTISSCGGRWQLVSGVTLININTQSFALRDPKQGVRIGKKIVNKAWEMDGKSTTIVPIKEEVEEVNEQIASNEEEE